MCRTPSRLVGKQSHNSPVMVTPMGAFAGSSLLDVSKFVGQTVRMLPELERPRRRPPDAVAAFRLAPPMSSPMASDGMAILYLFQGVSFQTGTVQTVMRYLVGIDLGTTNSALAYVDLQNRPRVGNLGLKTFPVPQLVAAGQVARAAAAAVVPVPARASTTCRRARSPCRGNRTPTYAVGEFARNHGAQGARPAGVVREVVALPPGRRSHRPAAAVGRAAGRAATVAAGGVDALPASTSSRRGTTPRTAGRGRPARRPDGRAHGAGVVRRRGPQPDRPRPRSRPG